MFETILTLIHGTFLLIFGFVLSGAFSNLRLTRRNALIFLGLSVFSGGLQLAAMLSASEEIVWKIYPLVTHLPLILLLCLVYHRPLATAAAAVFTAYLFCVPVKWFGLLVGMITGSEVAELIARILSIIPVGFVAVSQMSTYFAEIFSKDIRSVCIFGFIPAAYYVFDYIAAIYTDLWTSNHPLVAEFMPFLLAVTYMVFCATYYKEYEQKADAQRKEHIIQIAVEQQTKEVAAIRQSAQEIRLLRHDMRMFLSSLAISIENGEMETVRIMINSQISQIDGAKLMRYCSNDILNYVISDYAARCKEKSVDFNCSVKLGELTVDELMLSSILSNALDNALHAQRFLSPEKRSIRLMLQNSGGKILLSVKNAVGQQVLFADGLPVSAPGRHGYGTQSIRYMTERLGGNCQFFVQDNTFVLRVVI